MKPRVDWISRLNLEPHPEGGWFRRIHTAAQTFDTVNGPRPLATSIHYLLNRDQPIGRLHRNRSGILHFLQDGGPVEYLVVTAAGELQRTVLGVDEGREMGLFVAGGCWKASRLIGDASQALVSEVVTPGFDYADHGFVDRETVLRACPQHLDTLLEFLPDG